MHQVQQFRCDLLATNPSTLDTGINIVLAVVKVVPCHKQAVAQVVNPVSVQTDQKCTNGNSLDVTCYPLILAILTLVQSRLHHLADCRDGFSTS